MSQKYGVVWKKRILIPFWIVRIIIMLFLIAVYGYAIKILHDDHKDGLKAPGTATVVVFMLFIIAVLLADVLAIILFLRDSLTPAVFLSLNSFQTGFWTGVLILDFVAIGRGANAVGISFTIFVFLTFLALLIYAIVNYRRAKKHAQRGNYGPAHNPIMPSGATGNYAPYAGAAPYGQHTSYAAGGSHELPQYGGGASNDYYNREPAKPAQMI